jgi:hypothetical protein
MPPGNSIARDMRSICAEKGPGAAIAAARKLAP